MTSRPNSRPASVNNGWHRFVLAAVLLLAGLSTLANAAWQSGATGESTLAVADGPGVLALAKSARVLAVGREHVPGLALLNPDSGAEIASLPLAAKPISLALSDDGATIYALQKAGTDVTVITVQGASAGTKILAIQAAWPVGGKPVSLLADQARQRLYVADQAGRLVELDLATGAALRTLPVSGKPVRLALVSGMPWLLVGTQSGELLTVDLAAWAVIKTLALGSEIDNLLWWDTDSLAMVLPKSKDKWLLVDPNKGLVATSSAVEGTAARLALDRVGDNAYIGTQDDLSINKINLAARLNEGRHLLAGMPGDVVFDASSGVLYVSLPLENKLLRLDPLQAARAAPLSMRFRYRDVAVHQDLQQAFAVTERLNGLLSRWRLADRFRSVLPLGAGARKIAIDPASNLAVLGVTSPAHEIRFVDLSSATPKLLAQRITLGAEILAIATDPLHKRSVILADSAQGIRVLDNTTRQQIAALDTPETYHALAIHSGLGKAYLLSENRRLLTLDLARQTLGASQALDFKPGSIAVDENLKLAVISSPADNTLRVMDLNTLTFVRSVNLARHPRAVAVHPDFSQAIVASQESDLLSLVDLLDDKAAVQEFTGVPRPLSVAIASSTNQALALSGEKDELLFIDLPNPKPLLGTLIPTEVASGSAALVLKLQGHRFIRKSLVFWGGTSLTTRYIDPEQLEADVPANLLNAAAEVAVTVRNPQPGGGDSGSLKFTVTASAPVLSSLTPGSLRADGSDQAISLTGQHFLPTSYVQFADQQIATAYVSPTQLTATVPGSLLTTPGSATVAVYTPLGGQSAKLTVQINSSQQHINITGITPDRGVAGAQVVIAGTGFEPGTAKNTVKFAGDAVASVVAATATQLTVTVPASAQTGPVTVANSLGTASWPAFTVTREQDFGLNVSPASVDLLQNSAAAVSVQLASSGSQNYTGLASLSASGLPPGVTARFEPANLTAGQPGVLRLESAPGASTGVFPVTITALAQISGINQSRTGKVNVTVKPNSGLTGMRGRFITPAGDGISDIRVTYNTTTTTTDSAGNFLLTGLPAGKVELRFDATPAHPLYPIWPHIVTLAAGQVSVLEDWIIHPPPADDKFKPIAMSNQEQTITDTRYPGLAITIPAGVTIVGWDGVKKDRIAVERLDPDRLPVTPPPIATNSVYQLYFGTPMGGVPSAPIPVTLPNDIDLQPGQKTNLWFYDGSPMGGTGEWKIGGTGTASADGKVIVSDAGSGIPRFCGVCGLPCFEKNQNTQPNEQSPENRPPDNQCKSPSGPVSASPKQVRFATGNETPEETDLYVSSIVDLMAHRSFNPYEPFNNIAGTVLSLGLNWTLGYDITLLNLNASLVRIIQPGNIRTDFTPDGQGGFSTSKNRAFDGAVLKQDSGGWKLTLSEGSQWRFAAFGVAGLQYLVEQRDASGKTLTLQRRPDGRITFASSGLRSLRFAYGANDFVSSVEDDIGRKVQYAYNADNRITHATAPDGGVTRYTYLDDTNQLVVQSGVQSSAVAAAQTAYTLAPPNPCLGLPGNPPQPYRINSITYPGKAKSNMMFYSKSGRVLREVLDDGQELTFAYKLTGACATSSTGTSEYQISGESWAANQAGQVVTRPGIVVETTVTDALGNSSTQRFNQSGQATETVDSLGQKVTYTRDTNDRITAITDAIGRTWRYQYDANGNRTRSIDPDGRNTDYTYDPKWNSIASVSNYLDNGDKLTRTLEYDPKTGRMLKDIDALGNVTRYTHTSSGQIKTVIDPLGNVTTLNYNPEGDLISVKDALGNTAKLDRDPAGRQTQSTDPLGFSSQARLSAIDQLTEVTDPIGGKTQLNYRPDRNLASVVNPLGNAIETYDYDATDRLAKITDAKGKSAQLAYDNAGRLASATDRKGQATTLAYDAAGRVTQAGLPDGASLHFSYDAVGRLAALEEKGGASPSRFDYRYDNRDLLVQETIQQQGGSHVITYQYDALGRRIARRLDNTDSTAYSYDKAGRVTSIKFNSEAPVAYEWDAASRLTAKRLSNGVRMEYRYDAASRLLGIVYRKPDNAVLDSIAYSYDANGRRTSKTAGLPSRDETPFAATYDAANRMASFTLTASGETFDMAYDDNGNLVSKTSRLNGQATTYSWDVRNRLVGMAGPGLSASFAYDAMGRRIGKTVNGQRVQFLYDGPQAIAELAGNTVSASLLTGIAIDEMLARYTAAGARHYLSDALGSVIALLKDDASVQNYYAYSPYGETTATANDEGNASEYTGRENDLTQAYYYRARYYDPILKRFISSDPIGLSAGLNFYAYANSNPVNFTDPDGNIPLPVITGAIGAAAGFFGNIAAQLAQNGGSWKCINWKNVGIATGVGAVSGALAPFVATTGLGAMVLGAGSNVGQYGLTQMANGDPVSWTGAVWNAGTGALGGALGGPISRGAGIPFSTNSPWLNPQIARALNQQAAAAANTGVGNFARNVGGSFTGNIDPPGSGAGSCECQ